MLQVTSGKFFKSADRIREDSEGVLYSNYAWDGPITTSVATLQRTNAQNAPARYTLKYVNQVEKDSPPKNTLLVALPDNIIVEQFRLLSTFGLKAFFHREDAVVMASCREKGPDNWDNGPAFFVPRFLASKIAGRQDEVDTFVSLTNKVISLPRSAYKGVILALRSFNDALQVVGQNHELAYSMLVFCLDSLAQEYDSYEPQWEHYPQEVRGALERLFVETSSPPFEQVQAVLLKDANLRATRRFIDFTAGHLDDSFFRGEAPAGRAALRKSEVEHALRNAYNFRSRYAHELSPMVGFVKIVPAASGDVVRMSNQTYLTLNGLCRLTHHVITQFIMRQPAIDGEDIDWRRENPYIIQVPMAPEMWVHREDGLTAAMARSRLAGHLSQLESYFVSGGQVTNLKNVLAAFQPLMNGATRDERLAILALNAIYSSHSEDGDVPENFSEFMQPHLKELHDCSIESMLVMIEIGGPWRWTIDECRAAWDGYRRDRFKERGFQVPVLYEIALLSELARKYLESGDQVAHSALMAEAILDAAGWPGVQTYLANRQNPSDRITIYDICKAAKGVAPAQGEPDGTIQA